MQRCSAIALVLLLTSTQALGWGGAGHRITGYIAEPLLSAAARQQVHQLLGDESLAAAATYMDLQRQSLSERWPQSERWHYDNQPVCGGQTNYCNEGNCATRQLERWRAILADRSASSAERALALRLLVHLLGDIHQPLHMADNRDRGGNNLWVRLDANGQRYKLHEVFDTVLIKQLMNHQGIERYASRLRKQFQAQRSEWQRGTPSEWAEQTHQLGLTHTYALLPGFACGVTYERVITLPPSYIQDARQYVPQQLAKAGMRIAAVLNVTLG